MVSNEVILDTVKRMVASGVDDDTIRVTLKGIELSDAEIEEIIAEARGGQAKKPQPKSPPKSQPAPAVQDGAADEGAMESEADGEGELPEDPQEPDYGGEEEVHEEDVSEIKKQINASSGEQAAMHTTTHQMLDEHYGKLGEVHESITELHQKIDSAPQLPPEAVAKISALDSRISGLEKEISEVKANTIALQGILQKILEANREMIAEVQRKK